MKQIELLRVDITDFYPNLKEHPYAESFSEIPEGGFEVGDLLYDEENNSVGMVLGCICYKSGELRLDSDGMRPIDKLRYATTSDLESSRNSERIINYLKNK